MRNLVLALLVVVACSTAVPSVEAHDRHEARRYSANKRRATKQEITVISNSGSALCPCLASDDLPESTQQEIVNDYMLGDRDMSQDLNMFEKGNQCGYHHQAEAICNPPEEEDDDADDINGCSTTVDDLEYPFTNLEGLQAQCQQVPQECQRQFCVIDVGNCVLDFAKLSAVEFQGGTVAPDSSHTDYYNTSRITADLEQEKLKSGYGISYATCGYLDYNSGKTRQEQILLGTANRTLKVALLHGSAGWTSVFAFDGRHFDGPWQNWRGPGFNFIQKASLQGGFKLHLTDPSRDYPEMNLTGRAIEYYNGSTSPFDLCIYAASAGYVDLCLGDFTITHERIFEANWLKLQTRKLFLVVPFEYGDNSVWDDVVTLFKPYQGQTWAFMLLFVIPTMAVLFFWFDDKRTHLLQPLEPWSTELDRPEEKNEFGEPRLHVELREVPWHQRFLRQLSVTYLSLLTQSFTVNALSTAAKVNVYGFTVILFGFGLTYTANLAAQLTVQYLKTPVNSFEEALDQGYRFCVTRKMYSAVKTFHPLISPDRFAVDDFDGLPGFDANELTNQVRALVLKRLDPIKAETSTSYCHAAIVPQEDLEQFNSHSLHCNLIVVGKEVAAEAAGMPMSPAQGAYLEDTYDFLSALESRGDYIKELADIRPQSRCPTDGRTNKESGFTIRQMGGIWIVSFFFSAVAIIVHVYNTYAKPDGHIQQDAQGRQMYPNGNRNQWGSLIDAPLDTIFYLDIFTTPDPTGQYHILKNRGYLRPKPKVGIAVPDSLEGGAEYEHVNSADA